MVLHAMGVVLLVATAARASDPLPPDVMVRWTAPPECPDLPAVEDAISERLRGLAGTRAVEADAVVEGRAHVDGGEYVLDLTVQFETAVASRQIRGRDCGLLARATAVVVATAIDPTTTLDQLRETMDVEAANVVADPDDGTREADGLQIPEPGATEPTAVADQAPTPEIDPVAADDHRDRSRPPRSADAVSDERMSIDLGVFGRIAGGVGAGILPGAGGGLGLTAGLEGEYWRAEATASHWFSRPKVFPGESAIGADFSLWSGGARGCGVPGSAQVKVPLCGGAEVGRIRAAGFGGRNNGTVRPIWGAIVAGAAIVWLPRPWIGVFGGAEGLVALRRPIFAGDDRPQQLHRAAPVAIRGLVGIELHLPSSARS